MGLGRRGQAGAGYEAIGGVGSVLQAFEPIAYEVLESVDGDVGRTAVHNWSSTQPCAAVPGWPLAWSAGWAACVATTSGPVCSTEPAGEGAET